MDGQQLEENMDMTNSTNALPPLWEHVKKHLAGCLLCGNGKRKLAFLGGFKPPKGEQGLWFKDVPDGAIRTRFFGLCHYHLKEARKTQMGSVHEHFRRQLAAERAASMN